MRIRLHLPGAARERKYHGMESPVEFTGHLATHEVAAASPETVISSRAPYAAPSLAVYGPVSELTQTVGSRGKRDKGFGRRRTGF